MRNFIIIFAEKEGTSPLIRLLNPTHSLVYEDFLTDKKQYLSQILSILELNTSTPEIDAAIQQGTYFEKVHSDDITNFVVNHEEVKEKFGKYHSGVSN